MSLYQSEVMFLSVHGSEWVMFLLAGPGFRFLFSINVLLGHLQNFLFHD